ncbi:DNA mismatch endonuclease Vsr [Fusobacterium necrophorum subsp. funduliforme B35]|uniref:Very short patch repair endonuclease n=1 Tax=Fusobacterium necrophorum subsp. funduliforme B35 TaxID=1226633 RepID=A0A017H4Q7_9FUSO|nr:very short patch repair endonuclease [Fusobacterium necrophorum]EYD69290.1 DNA mismatch endonuclease Vsr [Fusobacterium necrophorum subsp. funduliforme B35]KID49271.1 Fis family transcriptional regulator [Fusobacterium necrophorum subsp. funduliforme B35]
MKKNKPMTRSENMARVKSKNTKPEIFLRKLLWHKGFRYRINYRNLPGSPDIYLPKYKTAIFVNGCFWHMHENCKYSSIPKNNYEFWKNKLEGNVERDKKNYAQLESMGIKVIVVWGCEIKQMMKDECVLSKKMNSIYQKIIYNHNREVE